MVTDALFLHDYTYANSSATWMLPDWSKRATQRGNRGQPRDSAQIRLRDSRRTSEQLTWRVLLSGAGGKVAPLAVLAEHGAPPHSSGTSEKGRVRGDNQKRVGKPASIARRLFTDIRLPRFIAAERGSCSERA